VKKVDAIQRAQKGLVLSLVHFNSHKALSLHAPSIKIISSRPSVVRVKHKQFLLALFAPWDPCRLRLFTAETNLFNSLQNVLHYIQLRTKVIQLPVGATDIFLFSKTVHTGYEAHPASYSMISRGSFTQGKAAGR
jgi:hypothetical protein